MKLKHYIAQVWGAVASPPSPDNVRKTLLREAQLERLEALANAEDHSVQANAFQEQAQMLADRIQRLEVAA